MQIARRQGLFYGWITAKQTLADARKRLQAAGVDVIDRTSHDAIAAVETTIAGARDLSIAINAWEGHWPLNTYAVDIDRSRLSLSAQDRLEEGSCAHGCRLKTRTTHETL